MSGPMRPSDHLGMLINLRVTDAARDAARVLASGSIATGALPAIACSGDQFSSGAKRKLAPGVSTEPAKRVACTTSTEAAVGVVNTKDGTGDSNAKENMRQRMAAAAEARMRVANRMPLSGV